MPDSCPPRPSLRAFASGSLSEPEMLSTEEHLAICLDCARLLETITREQLAEIGPVQLNTRPDDTSPAVARLIETALAGFASSSRQEAEDAVRAALDPGTREGAIGKFAGYDVLEIAGSGGMGVVLKAHDSTLHRDVALKILSPHRAWNEADAVRLLLEARTIASLQHDHVVTIYSAGQEKGLPYLAMPFHAEGTLERHLHQTPKLDARPVAHIGLQLARALEATHAKGVLHRDIKPSNVLLEGGIDRVRLADFGLAEPVDTGDASPAKTIAGTPHYMSPEQARGEATDTRSDLFGLGALLYHLATGRTIYTGGDVGSVLAQARRGDIKPIRTANAEVPRPLAEIIDRLLARRPQDRFASATKVVAALEHLASDDPSSWRWFRRGIAATFAACFIASATILTLDWTGHTVIINSLLCQRTGDGYYLRGRFGTYPRLPDAIAAARPNDVIEARFSSEQVIDSFRIGGKPLTIRAANGYTPILVATNNAQPMILVDAPVTMEGLTLWRRGVRLNFSPLISVEKAPLWLLNCRLIRSVYQGQDVLIRGQLRAEALNEPPVRQRYRALVAFQHGSAGWVRNCVFAGAHTAAFSMRSSTNEPTRIHLENSLVVADATFFMTPMTDSQVDLESVGCVFVTTALVDLNESTPVLGLKTSWKDCFIDRSNGTLLQVNQSHGGEVLLALEWNETNVVYGGKGAYVHNRRKRGIEEEAGWNSYMGLTTNSHLVMEGRAFSDTCVRSCLTLQTADLQSGSSAVLHNSNPSFEPKFIGEGRPYEDFRRSAGYGAWQNALQTAANDWKSRRRENP